MSEAEEKVELVKNWPRELEKRERETQKFPSVARENWGTISSKKDFCEIKGDREPANKVVRAFKPFIHYPWKEICGFGLAV